MLDFLRDPVWQFVGLIISFLSLIIAIYVDRDKILPRITTPKGKSRATRSKRVSPVGMFFLGVSTSGLVLFLASWAISNFNSSPMAETPTITPTISPTSAPEITLSTPVQSAYPVNIVSSIYFSDDFSQGLEKWDIFEQKQNWGSINQTIESGQYRIDLNTTPQKAALFSQKPKTTELYDQITVSSEFKALSPSADASYGLFVLANDGDYYHFRIRNEGLYLLELQRGKDKTRVIDLTATNTIKQNDYNKVSVEVTKSYIILSINDQEVNRVSRQLSSPGSAGIIVSSNYNQQLSLLIDNFTIFKTK